ncbi:MAG: hypothetical protein ACK5UM_20090 [Pseudomonadota bacterium]|jgi:hypothetical protein|nr:hypothetical protein [Burkholderiales bacterium]MCA3253925.1 hypothetical protein [Rubrivivax sp.]MCA3260272.1 hypothetical protein [Rubrivivax sp.]MCE2913835.1 hypothetical protein [Rubrivivax sp.]MCZ8032067.1 hypothetical protein [Rubrivivax sp.]
MRFLMALAVLALCSSLGGCTRVQEAAMPVVDKINAAFPPSPEVKVAQERLSKLLADDAPAAEALQAQLEPRMALRALACSKDATVGRFDSVAAVRVLPLAAACFQEQDAELLKFYGVRTVGVLLAKPPLRPLAEAGPIAALPKGKLSHISSGVLARDAGVGVLRDGRGEGAVVEIPGGKLIAQLPGTAGASEVGMRLSPNGRVLVFNPSGQAPTFVEAESGSKIWSMSGNHGVRLLAWLPEVQGFALAGGDGEVLLADGSSGRFEVHPVSLKNSSYAAHLPGTPSRLLLGTARELVLVEHKRSPQGITATALKRYTIASGPGITSGQPVPMQAGRRVIYASMRDIGWLDLESGESGTWRSAPLFGIPFAKLDENRIMFHATDLQGMGLTPWALDITNGTVAPVDLGGPRGLIVDIGDRVGFLLRGNEAWFGDKASTGEAQPLDKPVAAFELELQLAKLQALLRESGEQGMAAGRPAAELSPWQSAPGMSGVPADAQVHMVGVYEGQGPSRPGVGPREPRNVRVVVRPSARPMVLVLSSYESVNWIVVNAGAQISAVLLSGYHPSAVAGIGAQPVLRIGSAYAYSAGSAEYENLRRAVTRYTGPREIRSFQGSYSGADFSVGGR